MKYLNILSIALLIASTSCKSDSSRLTVKNEDKIRELPKDTTKLWLSEGDKTVDTVLIICQGGPREFLYYDRDEKSSWRYLKGYEKNYYKIHLHQANTIDSTFFDTKITFEQAQLASEQSVEILNRAIQYFKNKNKTVIVLGHSYGAYLVQYYLATKTSLADTYGLVSVRVIDPKVAFDTFKSEWNGYYEDGKTFIPNTQDDVSDYSEKELNSYKSRQLLKAVLSNKNYIESLQQVDLTNTVYVYNNSDSRVGGLTENELNFLKGKGATIYHTNHPHGKTIYGFIDGVFEGKIKL